MPFQQITYHRAYLVQDVELALCSGHYPETKTIACLDTKVEAEIFCANLIKAATLLGGYGFYYEYRVAEKDYLIEPIPYVSCEHQVLINKMLNPKPDIQGYYEAAFIKPEEGRAVWLKGNNNFHGTWVNGKWELFNYPGGKFYHETPVKWKYVD
jgi:hypothetical protein